MKIKILYITLGSLLKNTSTSIFNQSLINGFVENGCKVDILTTDCPIEHKNYDVSIINEKDILYLMKDKKSEISKISLKNKIIFYFRRKIGNIIKSFRLYENKKVIKEVEKFSFNEEYDIVISASDPKISHLLVEKMIEKKMIRYKKWYQVWSDPFYLDITRKKTFVGKKMRNEEKRILTLADKILYISNLMIHKQKELYPELENKMKFIPIPFLQEIKSKKKNIMKKKYLYIGDYSLNVRDIRPLYKAFCNIEEELIICGSSNIHLQPCNNIKILDRVSYKRSCELIEEADVLVHLSNRKGAQIPGKIYQYSGTEKEILFILDGENYIIKDEFDKYDRYSFVDNNMNSIKEYINSSAIKKSLSIVEDFKPKNVARKVVDIYKLESEYFRKGKNE